MKNFHILCILPLLLAAIIFSWPAGLKAYETISTKERAETFDQGMEYYQRGIYDLALQWFLKAADQGDVNALLQVGLMFDFGQGVEQSFSEALHWYMQAAEQGDKRAMYLIGHMHDFGEGMPIDRGTAMFWYLKSAHLGYANAQYAVAKKLLSFTAHPRLREQAITWLQKAARQCHPLAERELRRLVPNQEEEASFKPGCG